jgi:Protein of unknown function (DUF2905)
MPLGRLLIFLGLALVGLGVVVIGLERLHLPLGRLPGDLSWRGKGWSVSFPLVTCLLLSALLSLILWIVSSLRR